MLVWIGRRLCEHYRGNPVMYGAIRNSFRSGNVRIIAAYRMYKVIYGGK